MEQFQWDELHDLSLKGHYSAQPPEGMRSIQSISENPFHGTAAIISYSRQFIHAFIVKITRV